MANENAQQKWNREKILKLKLSVVCHPIFLEEIGLGTQAEIGRKYKHLKGATFFPDEPTLASYQQLADEVCKRYKESASTEARNEEWKLRSTNFLRRRALKTVGDLVRAKEFVAVSEDHLSSHGIYSQTLGAKSAENFVEVLKYLGVEVFSSAERKLDLATKKAKAAAASIRLK